MNTIFPIPKRYVVVVSLIFVGVLLMRYSAVANAHRERTQNDPLNANMSDGIPAGMIVTALPFNAMNRHLATATFGRGVYMLYQVEPRVWPRPTPHPRP